MRSFGAGALSRALAVALCLGALLPAGREPEGG